RSAKNGREQHEKAKSERAKELCGRRVAHKGKFLINIAMRLPEVKPAQKEPGASAAEPDCFAIELRKERLLPAHIRTELLQRDPRTIIPPVHQLLRFLEGLFSGGLVPRFLIKTGKLIMDTAVLVCRKPQLVLRY